jgi:hypothetical protein
MSNAALINALVENNRYASVKLNAEQISAESFKAWNDKIKALHRSAYAVYEYCENNALVTEDASVNKSPVFDALREILAFIGDVKGHKLYANDALVVAIIGYAGKRGNKDSNALADVIGEIKFENDKLARENKAPNGKEDYIASIEARIAELEGRKAELLAQPDNRIKKPTMTSLTTFRSDVERIIARAIVGQKAKSLEELDAEEAARKEARKAAAKARKAAKKNATANA